MLRKCIALRPDWPHAHNNLGALIRDVGQFDEARILLQRAIELRADFPEAYVNLGGTFFAMGQTIDAITAYRRAEGSSLFRRRPMADYLRAILP